METGAPPPHQHSDGHTRKTNLTCEPSEHTDANWCRDNIVVNLPDNPRQEQAEERRAQQPAVVEGFQISVGQMWRL